MKDGSEPLLKGLGINLYVYVQPEDVHHWLIRCAAELCLLL